MLFNIYTYGNRITFFVLLIISLSGPGCNKYVEIDPPINTLTTATVFSDAASINAAVAGLYSYTFKSLPSFYGYGDWFGGMLSDEIYYRYNYYDNFRYNSLTSKDSYLSYFWNYPYQSIYQANSLIENIQASTLVSDNVKAQYSAEAKFIRAYAHFFVSNFFGDVPLILATDVNKSALASRTSKDSVYKAIVKDLLDAEAVLSAGTTNNRVNKWATDAFLAKVYLYQKDWLNAETKANAVITSGAYSLLTNLNQVFLRGSKEAIFQISSVNSGGYYDGYTIAGAIALPSSTTIAPYTLATDWLVNAFESGDQRKVNWLNPLTISGTTYYYPYKYKLRTYPTTSASSEEYVILRLAEQYLIRAEARAQQNNITGALSDLNVIRTRAGLGNLSGLNQAATLSAVEQERRVELFYESADRWRNLIRTGRANTVLGTEKSATWTAKDSLLPINYKELQNDPNLVQTPGY